MPTSACNTLEHHDYVPYGADIGGTVARSLCLGRTCDYPVSDYASLEELLAADFQRRSCIPGTIALALAGTYVNGRITITNNPTWPSVTQEELEARFGASVRIINDMQAAHLGAATFDREQLTLLKVGEPHPSRYLTVLTLSSGVNCATGLPDGSLPLARELGWTCLPIPPDYSHTTNGLARFIARNTRAPIVVEDLLSGTKGVDNIVDFLQWHFHRASPATAQEIQERRKQGKDSAELMAVGVMADDPFWTEVASVYAKLLGYLLRQIVIGELAGEVIIQGSVLNGTPGFAEWLFQNTGLLEILTDEAMEKSDIAREVMIYGLPSKIELGVTGARNLAVSMQKAKG